MTTRLLAPAEDELDEAVAYYNHQRPGLGAEFAREVASGISRIKDFPMAWQQLGPRVRRYRLRRFPYGLVYAPLADEIVVVAVMHLHRHPDYWKQRLDEI